MSVVKQADPAFYQRLRGRAVNATMRGATAQDLYRLGEVEMRGYLQRQLPNIVAAPDVVILEAIETEAHVVNELMTTDIPLCASYVKGGQGMSGPADPRRPFFVRMVIARVEAAAAGRKSPVSRTAPSDEDFQALYEAMLMTGADRSVVDKVFDRGLLNEPPEVACSGTLSLLDAILDQPDERGARLAAHVFAASGQTT